MAPRFSGGRRAGHLAGAAFCPGGRPGDGPEHPELRKAFVQSPATSEHDLLFAVRGPSAGRIHPPSENKYK